MRLEESPPNLWERRQPNVDVAAAYAVVKYTVVARRALQGGRLDDEVAARSKAVLRCVHVDGVSTAGGVGVAAVRR